ncbi:MAG: NAD(P)/FAD-dependent oxidoreductase [Frankia sp.]
METSEQGYDVMVVGGGTTGLSAALVLARCRRRVVVVDAGRPRNAAADPHNFLTHDGTPPTEFLAAARAEVAGYGVTILSATVRAVDRTKAGFTVATDGGRTLQARRLLVTTGQTYELPALPGMHERWGRDVLHCPYCHGYKVRDQSLGILADTPRAVHSALKLRQWSPDVMLFLHTMTDSEIGEQERAALAARDVRVVEGTVTGLVVEDDRLTGIRLADGTVVPRCALFVPCRAVPHDPLLTALGARTEETIADHRISTDSMGRTSVPGVWAAGDVTSPSSQLVTFAAAGTRAAIGLNADLVAEDITVAQTTHHTAPPVSTG